MMKPVHGSNAYWAREARNLAKMDEQLGKATYFLTLSCAEREWPDLLKFLRAINWDLHGVDSLDVAELCAKDPGNCVFQSCLMK
jgi:hypothetical protein